MSSFDYEEELKRQRDEEERAAARKSMSQPVQPQASPNPAASAPAGAPPRTETPASVAKTAQEKPDDPANNGIISNVGNFLTEQIGRGYWAGDVNDALAGGINNLAQLLPDNNLTTPIKNATAALDEYMLPGKENYERYQRGQEALEKRAAEEGNLLEKALQGTSTNLQGIEAGMEAGIALPFTIAARLTGQNAPWNNAPEIVKQSPVAEPIFNIARVLTPTILTGGVAGPWVSGMPIIGSYQGGLMAESALETATQDSADDLIAGRQMAQWVGEIADHIGFDGAELTREMIEGETPRGQALVGVVGFLQNYVTNLTGDQLLKYIVGKVTKARTAKALPQAKETPLLPPSKDVFGDGDLSALASGQERREPFRQWVDVRLGDVNYDDLPTLEQALYREQYDTTYAGDEVADALRRFQELGPDEQFAVIRRVEDDKSLGDVAQRLLDNSSLQTQLRYYDGHARVYKELPNGALVQWQIHADKFHYASRSNPLPDGYKNYEISWDAAKDAKASIVNVRGQLRSIADELEPGTIVTSYTMFDTTSSRAGAANAAKAAREYYDEMLENKVKKMWEEIQPPSDPNAVKWDSLSFEEKMDFAELRDIEIFDEGTFNNKRARLYEKEGFGKPSYDGTQIAVVAARPGRRGQRLVPVDYSAEEDMVQKTLGIVDLQRKLVNVPAPDPVNPKAPGTPEEQKIAKALGKEPDEVRYDVENINQPVHDGLHEPHEVVDLDTIVPVSQPSNGNQYVSGDALLREMMRDANIGLDGLTRADRKYFGNYEALTSEVGLQVLYRESVETLNKLRDAKVDVKLALERGLHFWQSNRHLIGQNFSDFARKFLMEMTTAIKPDELSRLKVDDMEGLGVALKEYVAVSHEGFIATSLINEELGVRTQKVARAVINFENADIDFTAAMDTFVRQHELLQLFLVPLRRAKRIWGVDGILQQKKSIAKAKDADIRGPLSPVDPPDIDAPSRDFETISFDNHEVGRTVRELWDAAKGGDSEALDILKNYATYIAYGDPETVLTTTNDITRAITQAKRDSTGDALTTIMYAFRLSRIRTMVTPVINNVSQLILYPLGDIASGKVAYGVGEMIGGLFGFNGALQDMTRAFKHNMPMLDGTTRVNTNFTSHKQTALKIEAEYNLQKQMLKREKVGQAAHFTNWLDYTLKRAANNPFLGMPGRVLMAEDEGAKSLKATQMAFGLAFEDYIKGTKKSPMELGRLIEKQLDTVFSNGLKRGKIISPEVIDVARNMTFQSDIPNPHLPSFVDNGKVGNFIDTGFRKLADASDESGFFKFFSPFTRMSYNALEKAGVLVAGALDVPGSQFLPGREIGFGAKNFSKVFPRYKAIMDGKMGEAAKLHLQSTFALGQLTMASAVVWAAAGMTTGTLDKSRPLQSWLLPADNEDGFIAIPHAKLEPYTTIISAVSDIVWSYQNNVITRGEYDRFMTDMTYAIGVNTLDKSFLLSVLNAAQILDVKNMDASRMTAIASSLQALVVPNAVPGVLGFFQPYQVNSKKAEDPGETLIAQLSRRLTGGLSAPVRYDELTGEPVVRSFTHKGSKGDYWKLVGARIFNEFAWPGDVTQFKQDPLRKWMQEIGMPMGDQNAFQTFKGTPLEIEDQGLFAKAMHEQGKYRDRLEAYRTSETFKDQWSAFQRFRKEGNEAKAKEMLRKIHSEVRKRRRTAQLTAIEALASFAAPNDPTRERFKSYLYAND